VCLGGGAQGNRVEGNLIGTDPTGATAWFNWGGVAINGTATGNHVGGPTPGRRNLISGNQTGVQILGDGTDSNVIAGNLIGTDLSGSYAVPNRWGVRLEWSVVGNTIGGDTPEERNWISGNLEHGVLLSDSGTANNAVIGNWIGTDLTGTGTLGNQPGIGIYGCGFNRVGGTEAGEGNLISGNEQASGIDIAGFEASDNVIVGNLVGLTPEGTSALGNGIGIGLGASARHCFIGGASAAEANIIGNNDIGIELRQAGTEYNVILGNRLGVGVSADLPMGNQEDGIWITDYAAHNWVQANLIAFNASARPADRAGVRIERSVGNTLRGNLIWANAGEGIVLAEGGNESLPAPVITVATATRVSGTACPGCTVEVFSDDEDEGRVYEGEAVADADGRFTFAKPAGLTGPFVTATATDGEGNTSEFSAPTLIVRARLCLPLLWR
jgi:titin